MADFSYLQLLYKDLKTKLDSIHKYGDAIESQLGDIYQSVYESIGYSKKKYDMLSSFVSSQVEHNPQTQFDMEDPDINKPPKDVPDDDSDNIEDLNISINQSFQEINYRFEKQERNLQNLVVAHQELQDIVNQIFEAWGTICEGKTSK